MLARPRQPKDICELYQFQHSQAVLCACMVTAPLRKLAAAPPAAEASLSPRPGRPLEQVGCEWTAQAGCGIRLAWSACGACHASFGRRSGSLARDAPAPVLTLRLFADRREAEFLLDRGRECAANRALLPTGGRDHLGHGGALRLPQEPDKRHEPAAFARRPRSGAVGRRVGTIAGGGVLRRARRLVGHTRCAVTGGDADGPETCPCDHRSGRAHFRRSASSSLRRPFSISGPRTRFAAPPFRRSGNGRAMPSSRRAARLRPRDWIR